MVVDVVMPKMGESITEGTILEWRKNVGEKIETDEILLEIGTDKVDSEIPSSHSGIIAEILAESNDVVEVGKIIARIDTGKAKTLIESKSQSFEPIIEKKNEPIIDESIESPAIQSYPTITNLPDQKRFYSPVVKVIAKKEGISDEEMLKISGTGKNGRVSKKDILLYIKKRSTVSKPISDFNQPQPSPAYIEPQSTDEVIEMDKMRKSIAEHMRASLNTSAHVHLMNEVDMTHIVNYVELKGREFKNREGFSLTYTPFIIHACVKALKVYPAMNSSIEGTTIVRKKNINIGLAVAVESGLIVPVISNCEELNFLGLCRKVRDLSLRSRNKQIKPEELSGSTFSLSNFGVFDVIAGTPIINQPNVGILGVGTIKKKPVVIEFEGGDTIGIRQRMYLSLGFDHRLIDGAGASKFVKLVKTHLESIELEHLL